MSTANGVEKVVRSVGDGALGSDTYLRYNGGNSGESNYSLGTFMVNMAKDTTYHMQCWVRYPKTVDGVSNVSLNAWAGCRFYLVPEDGSTNVQVNVYKQDDANNNGDYWSDNGDKWVLLSCSYTPTKNMTGFYIKLTSAGNATWDIDNVACVPFNSLTKVGESFETEYLSAIIPGAAVNQGYASAMVLEEDALAVTAGSHTTQGAVYGAGFPMWITEGTEYRVSGRIKFGTTVSESASIGLYFTDPDSGNARQEMGIASLDADLNYSSNAWVDFSGTFTADANTLKDCFNDKTWQRVSGLYADTSAITGPATARFVPLASGETDITYYLDDIIIEPMGEFTASGKLTESDGTFTGTVSLSNYVDSPVNVFLATYSVVGEKYMLESVVTATEEDKDGDAVVVNTAKKEGALVRLIVLDDDCRPLCEACELETS